MVAVYAVTEKRNGPNVLALREMLCRESGGHRYG
jgi:hypothetical protein